MYYWVMQRPVRRTAAETENSLVSTMQWFQYCRDIAASMMNEISSSLGGEGVVVHVDEIVLDKKKSKSGRKLMVLGLYDTNLKKGLMEMVPNRSDVFLLPIIKRLVKPGSIIYTNNWSGYGQLSEMGYVHHIVEDSSGFVDPTTGKRTESIEKLWRCLRKTIKSVRSSQNDLLNSHLNEVMYRKWFNLSVNTPMKNWETFIQHVKECHPFENSTI
ncbi:unnamed protein product [Trichobilharzia szidati]|nr:unnamed protein product [Trichobilharzia szidati]